MSAKPIKKLTDLLPDPRNFNKHTERGSGMMERSIRECGFGDSLTVDRNGAVISGNQRLETLADLQMEKAIVVQSDGTRPIIHQRVDLDLETDPKARKLGLYQNRVGEVNLEWDVSALGGLDATELEGLWNADELKALMDHGGEVDEGPEPQIDKAAELQQKWDTKLGQVWEIGRHRLICNDCLKISIEKHRLMLTDPPYGLNIVQLKEAKGVVGGGRPVTIGTLRARKPYAFGGVKTARGVVGGGKMVDATLYRPVHGDDSPFDPTLLLTMAEHHVLFGGNYFAPKLPASRCWIVWDKNNTGNFADAELAWTSFERSVRLFRFTWNGLVREGSRKIEGKKRMHPTQKPVGLFASILEEFSETQDSVLDPYAGVGTTLLACELKGRKATCVEIEPAYVAVILQRMADMGLTPKLVQPVN